MVWDNVQYSVNYILNKLWLASSQAGNMRGTTGQEVEAGQQKQENSGKRKDWSAVLTQPYIKQDVTTSPKKVPNYMANIDKNNGKIWVIIVKKKPELMGQYN